LRIAFDDPEVGAEILRRYSSPNKFESIGLDLISRHHAMRDERPISERRFFDDAIRALFGAEYPMQRGVLLKDLSRELGDIPAANAAIRAILTKRGYLWSIHVWRDLIEQLLNGEQIPPYDEWKYLPAYRKQPG
jgi:hypothetical protein